jgi:hypothetical protein
MGSVRSATLCLFPHRSLIVKRPEDDTPRSATETFNYFNYFTEIEEEFVRRRGKPMFISPLDWALVESWKNAGIPLHIVLRAINEAFDALDARKHRFRKVNSIFYCEQAVETTFADYRLSQVGSAPTDRPDLQPQAQTERAAPTSAFSKETLLAFINSSLRDLESAVTRAQENENEDVRQAMARAQRRLHEIASEIEGARQISDEALEQDFDAIDRMLLQAASLSLGEKRMADLHREAEAQLKAYKKKIDEKIYAKTVENFINRRLREIHLIPRLSLFYI